MVCLTPSGIKSRNMKASEFIEVMQNAILNYGDLEVTCRSFNIQDKAEIGVTDNQNVFIILPKCCLK